MSASMHFRQNTQDAEGNDAYSVVVLRDDGGPTRVRVVDATTLATVVSMTVPALAAMALSQALSLAGTMEAGEQTDGGKDKGGFGSIGRG